MMIGQDGSEQAMGTRILLVEDDPSSQDLIRALCEGRGDSVDTAADGFLGLRLLSERRHDVALIDYHLPEMDGYALARLMREVGRPEGKLRLVGITADGHGLASRRGADTLFDAILVKPLEPSHLFATLDRLMQSEPVASPTETDPADALWRRRGLSGRPNAFLTTRISPSESEALSQAFYIVESVEEADIVLVTDQAGLEPLRALRASGTAGFLPSVTLMSQIGAACDLVFQVGDPECWTALAQACRDFAARRADLKSDICSSRDVSSRLLALLWVTDRSLILSASSDNTNLTYETGSSPTARLAAVLTLAEEGKLVCEPNGGGVAVRLTEAGRDIVRKEAVVQLGAALNKNDDQLVEKEAVETSNIENKILSCGTVRWTTPCIIESMPPLGATRIAASNSKPENFGKTDHDLPIFNTCKHQELKRLIGVDQIDRLRGRLIRTLVTGFASDTEQAALAREAHVMISMAGSFGFDRLAENCRALEAALTMKSDYNQLLNDVKQASLQVQNFRW